VISEVPKKRLELFNQNRPILKASTLKVKLMIVAIHQPQYLPWLGYFDKIDQADIFVFLDNVQFKKNEWQNRNKIKTADRWQWLTVPVRYKYPQLINEVKINDKTRWQHKHRQAIISNYQKAPFYDHLIGFFDHLSTLNCQYISKLNIDLVRNLVKIIGINTSLYVASQLDKFPEEPDDRIITIIKYLGADSYLAGSGGKNYMNLGKYKKNGVEVLFQEFNHPVYRQLFGDFEPNMSIIDLILNYGENSLNILRGNYEDTGDRKSSR
jgi:hypothetical protein